MYFPCSAKDVYETLNTSLVQPMFEDEEQILRNGSQIKPRLNGEIYRLKPLWKMATVTIIRYTCISLIYWKIWHTCTCIRQKQNIDHFWEFVLHLQTWAEPRSSSHNFDATNFLIPGVNVSSESLLTADSLKSLQWAKYYFCKCVQDKLNVQGHIYAMYFPCARQVLYYTFQEWLSRHNVVTIKM
jgi:hypothetical protein